MSSSYKSTRQHPPESFLKTENGLELLQVTNVYEDVLYPQWKEQLDQLVIVVQENPKDLDLKKNADFKRWHELACRLMARFVGRAYNTKRFYPSTDSVTAEHSEIFARTMVKGVLARLGSLQEPDTELKDRMEEVYLQSKDTFIDWLRPTVAKAFALLMAETEDRMAKAMECTSGLFSFEYNQEEGKINTVKNSIEPEEAAAKAREVFKAMIAARVTRPEHLVDEMYKRTKNLLNKTGCLVCGKESECLEEHK